MGVDDAAGTTRLSLSSGDVTPRRSTDIAYNGPISPRNMGDIGSLYDVGPVSY
jgi:hypothetical protein